jgi:nitrate/TMAO reductase-like tetraheme cytochrome c subunit
MVSNNRYSLLNIFIITALSTAALSLVLLFAADLSHHGMFVNSEGNAAECLQCHDGSKENQRRKGKITPIRSHKVLIKYPPPGRGRAFNPLNQVLAAGMKLENGMVTCISCHDLNNQNKNHLAVDTTEYARKLCYVCHLDIG